MLADGVLVIEGDFLGTVPDPMAEQLLVSEPKGCQANIEHDHDINHRCPNLADHEYAL